MTSKDTIFTQLKQAGLRLTSARKAMVEELMNHEHPHTAKELQSCLAKQGMKVNLVTIYREMDTLSKQGIARLLDFGDGQRRIEFVVGEHHHHLICRICEAVEHIEIEDALHALEATLAKQSHFRIETHQLEFFGVCRNCVAK